MSTLNKSPAQRLAGDNTTMSTLNKSPAPPSSPLTVQQFALPTRRMGRRTQWCTMKQLEASYAQSQHSHDDLTISSMATKRAPSAQSSTRPNNQHVCPTATSSDRFQHFNGTMENQWPRSQQRPYTTVICHWQGQVHTFDVRPVCDRHATVSTLVFLVRRSCDKGVSTSYDKSGIETPIKPVPDGLDGTAVLS